ncbi:MAG: ACP S-malonyltransferase [Solirubrobacteraceae bacterium]|nr:ACP S-malonyltransferase [Solirubrobacteraceae bacterium]
MGVVILCPGQGQVPRDLGEQVLAAGDDLAAAYAGRLGDDAHLDPQAGWARLQAALVAVGIGRGRRVLAALSTPERAAEFGPVVAIAGHSLGELTALALGGALDPAVAVALAADRGQAFDDARHASGDWGDAGMLAISGPTVQNVIEELVDRHGVTLANDNADDQVVVSGAGPGLVALAGEARELGLRAVRLETTGPAHSPYMAPVVPVFLEAARAVSFGAPATPVYSGLTAAPFTDPPQELATLITGRVRWRETLHALAALSPTHVVDTGPASAMARLARKTVPDVPAITLDDLEVAA